MRPVQGTITDPSLDHLWAKPRPKKLNANTVRLSQREAAYLLDALLAHADKHPRPEDLPQGLIEKVWGAYKA